MKVVFFVHPFKQEMSPRILVLQILKKKNKKTMYHLLSDKLEIGNLYPQGIQ